MKLSPLVCASLLLTGCTLDRIVPAPPRPQTPKAIPYRVVPRQAPVVLAHGPATSPARQRVLLNMCFNLGSGGLLEFRKSLAAMERGDFETAAREMKASKWATQVGDRADRLAALMRSG